MEPLEKKLRLWKNYFVRILPKCVLCSILFCALHVITGSLFSTKPDMLSSSTDHIADLVPGEVVPYKILESKSHDSYYDTIFNRFYDQGYVSWNSKALTIDSTYGQDVAVLRKLGVADVKGIPDMPSASFVISGQGSLPFENNTFDFEFFGYNSRFKYWIEHPVHIASEIGRTLKVGGYVVVHLSINDGYSFESFLNLFTCCMVAWMQKLNGLDNSRPIMHEMILKKRAQPKASVCTISDSRRYMVNNLEPLLTFNQPGNWEGRPLGDVFVKRRYLPTLVDLGFHERYIYIDLGANSYNSSIGVWFDKEYPKQKKPFEIYAVEPDSTFHEELKSKPGLTLLPYAAWVKNENLTFEIYKMPEPEEELSKIAGYEEYKMVETEGTSSEVMGYVQDDKDSYGKDVVSTYTIPGFDFAEWLVNTVTSNDFVVVKMDVEGDEFKLLDRLSEAGALCLIDELFLECHFDYDAFQYGPKHNRTLSDCIQLYQNLRKDGYFVHQWW